MDPITECSKDLRRAFLLGADRTELSEKSRLELRKYVREVPGPRHHFLLDSLATLQTLQAGAISVQPFSVQPAPLPAEASHRLPSPEIEELFQAIPNKELFQKTLPEWIRLFSNDKLVLPLSIQPLIFTNYRYDHSLLPFILQVMGTRGSWLAQQNPEWENFLLLEKEKIWQTGNLDQRVAYLRHLVQREPNQALQELQTTWSTERPDHQCLFLKVLQEVPSPVFFPFFQSLLDEKSDEIPFIAARGLMQFPDSPLREGLFSAFIPAFTFDSEASQLAFNPNDIHINRIRQYLPFFDRSNTYHINQVLALLPPKSWEDHFKLNTKTIIGLFRPCLGKELSTSVFYNAAVLHQDQKWLSFFLKEALRYESENWNTDQILHLVDRIPAEILNKELSDFLEYHNDLIPQDSLIYYILLNRPFFWDAPLSTKLVDQFQQYLSYAGSYFYDDNDHYSPLLIRIGLHAPPYLFDRFQIGWPRDSFSWYKWEKKVQDMLRLLYFRRRIYQVLDEHHHKHANK